MSSDEAPERITARWEIGTGLDISAPRIGDNWQADYIRADLIEALTAERDELKSILGIIAVSHPHLVPVSRENEDEN